METLLEFTRRFATAEACLEHLEAVRWKDGAFCPHCGITSTIYHYSDGAATQMRKMQAGIPHHHWDNLLSQPDKETSPVVRGHLPGDRALEGNIQRPVG